MPFFCIRDYDGALQMLVDSFDRHAYMSNFEHLGYNLKITFSKEKFMRVFGIPGRIWKKIEMKAKKITHEEKEHLIQLISRVLTLEEMESLTSTSKIRGIKKSFIAP